MDNYSRSTNNQLGVACIVALASGAILTLGGCGDGGPTVVTATGGWGGDAGVGMGGAAGGAAGTGGSSASGGTAGSGGLFAGGSGGGGIPCGVETCPATFKCRYDACVPELGTCDNFDDCPGDSYCDAKGECIPYGIPPEVTNDPTCERRDALGGVNPTVQCEWDGTLDPNDPTAKSGNVYSTPIVVDLNLDNDPGKLQPSVILTSFTARTGERIGTMRVFDGRTCEEQLRVGGADAATAEDRPGYGTQWAVADLDGDVASGGRPEIIGLHNTGDDNHSPLSLYALKLDVVGGKPTATRMWYGRTCDPSGDQIVPILTNRANFGPGVWDVDDDGRPEILVDEMVFDADGCLLNGGEVLDYLTHGPMSAIADVDLDGAPDLVRFNRIARWDRGTTEWVNQSWFVPNAAHKPGHVAVVDLGQYSAIPGKGVPNQLPEVVVVSAQTTKHNPNSTGTIRVQALDGTVVWGPIELHHDVGIAGGHGGPPTASDFDGDGQVEFATAANQYYAVYDPDCVAALAGASPPERPGGTCVRSTEMQSLPDGILWARLSQDFSSSATGSSIFDFNGDGSAEAVYGDECFLRVYEGATGKVLFSSPASSGTGFELPVIADVDGDFATEIVVTRSRGTTCPATDPLSPGSEPFVKKGGFVILRDPEDRWAASRPIWNQHAYSITHISDDGRVPRSSEMEANWTNADLNNFRQNTQGELGMLQIADLTVVLSDLGSLCAWESGSTTVESRVCNRGTNPVQDGVPVRFIETDDAPAAGIPQGTLVCEALTSQLLMPGQCEEIECTGNVSGTKNIYVIVDPEGNIADCHPGNNDGAGAFALCPNQPK